MDIEVERVASAVGERLRRRASKILDAVEVRAGGA
jgi:hypothetical protein